MSKGPWKKKEPGEPKIRSSNTHAGVVHHVNTFIEPWRDRNAASRAEAKRKTDELRERAIEELAKRSRDDARQRGATKFIGRPCDRHASGERYVAGGECVLCVRERDALKAGRMLPPIKLRVGPHRTPVVSKNRAPIQRANAVLELDGES